MYPTTPCQSLLPLVADHPLVRNHTHSCTQTNTGIVLGNGQRVAARAVVVNADPFRMRELAGAERFEPAFNSWLDERRRDGTTLKVNLALKELPRFACLPERRGQHNTTAHLVPPEADVPFSPCLLYPIDAPHQMRCVDHRGPRDLTKKKNNPDKSIG